MKKKRKSLIRAELEMEAFLKKVGYSGKYQGISVNEIPDYRIKVSGPSTSDKIPGATPKKQESKYSGTELLGIAVMHKSNLVPIRKDNKESAVEVSQMRRN